MICLARVASRFVLMHGSTSGHPPVPQKKGSLCPGSVQPLISQTDKLCGNAVVEINARLLPLSLHRTFRQLLHRSDFGEREPAEKLQVNYFSELRFDFRQLI